MIVVFKAPGVLTQGDITGVLSLLDETKAWLKSKYDKPGNVFLGLVHRLDRPCRGAILFAKTSKAASRISEQIRNRRFHKIYRICVEGTLIQPSGTWVDWLAPMDQFQMTVVQEGAPGAQRAELHYRTLESRGQKHLVEVNLITGRKHQIRAQFAHRGLPVVGDVKYGAQPTHREGIALMSYSLEFAHPTKDESIIVTVPNHFIQEFHDFLL